MPIPAFRFDFDKTGMNQDNLVQAEPHILEPGLINRALVPKYAPFYTEHNLSIRDVINNYVLVKDVDYKLAQFNDTIAVKTGKEAYTAIIIVNQDVSDQVEVTYQAVGGLYQILTQDFLKYYESVLNDSRPVDWDNILNKPFEYPAQEHLHLLDEIYGFGPLVSAIDRVADAISLWNTPAYQALVDWINMRLGERLVVMMNAEENEYRRDMGIPVKIEAVSAKAPYKYYWRIHHLTTQPEDFLYNTGEVDLKYGKNTIMLMSSYPSTEDSAKEFRVELRDGSAHGDLLYISGVIGLKEFDGPDHDVFMRSECGINASIESSPEFMFVTSGFNRRSN